MKKKRKYLVVTGGVLSGLGKGVAAASIGALLKSNLKIVPIKCDGYLNTDPGTMNPIEHGEVFVLDDKGEVDMDFGHYERFLSIDTKSHWNITMGKVYSSILEKERAGKFLGSTVQLIPHVTDEIKKMIYEIVEGEDSDLTIIEIGGTIGDMEVALFVEALRQMRYDVDPENIMFAHLTYIPIPSGVNEQKSKPTQTSVKMLNQYGIYPDMIIGRCSELISEPVKMKIARSCNIAREAVISGVDVDPIYELPLIFEEQGVAEFIHKRLNIYSPPKLTEYRKLVNSLKKVKSSNDPLKIAICGKYTGLEDSYASIREALTHCSAHHEVGIEMSFVDTTFLNDDNVEDELKGIDGVIVPGGFGTRGLEGKISTIKYIREKKIPFLGICLGMQLAVIEYARNAAGIKDAMTREVEQDGISVKEAVIDILPEQRSISAKGATMRRGGNNVEIKEGTKAFEMFGKKLIRRRFRHRYEVNPEYIKTLEDSGLVFSGKAPGREIMQLMELQDHPFFMACQFHPELTSRLENPSVIFYYFIKTAFEEKQSREN